MTVVHVHPDSSSLDQLMAVLAPVLAPFRALLELRSIDVYGSPSDAVLGQLRAKADLLGGTITIHHRAAGVDAGFRELGGGGAVRSIGRRKGGARVHRDPAGRAVGRR
jgi:hypothetical protein